jgi:hypothetical protein
MVPHDVEMGYKKGVDNVGENGTFRNGQRKWVPIVTAASIERQKNGSLKRIHCNP